MLGSGAVTTVEQAHRPTAAAGGVSSLVAVTGAGQAAATALGLRRLGPLAAGTELQVGLALRPRDPAGLARYALAVSTPSSPSFHRFLAPTQLAARFGPSAATVRAAVSVLRRDGLRVGPVAADHLLVPASGSAARIEAAFRVRLSAERSSSGTLGWAASGAPMVPAAIGDSLTAVVGLDQLAQPQALGLGAAGSESDGTPASGPAAARPALTGTSGSVQSGIAGASAGAAGLPAPCPDALDDAIGSNAWTDDAIANAYGFSPLLDEGDLGQGETIAVYELEPFERSDVDAFDRCYFGRAKPAQVRVERVDGFGFTGHGVGESVLDIEDLSALAPDARIIVYEAPNTEYGQIDEYNEIVSQDRANIVTTSWAECETQAEVGEPGVLQVENTLFEEAAAEGQTVLAAAGDTGSDSCASTQFGSMTPASPYLSVDDPASQPYVVGVGGVSMQTASTPPIETSWNDGASSGGGGGGRSNTWQSPPWQAGSGIAGTAAGRREVPDVSASADEFRGTTIYFSPSSSSSGVSDSSQGWTVIGGTSSATPQWAAALALAADSSACASLPKTRGGRDLGFVAPELYAVASNPSSYAASFTDVTTGDNDVFHLGHGYSAGPGYNLATGLGTPSLAYASGSPGLAANLCAVATGNTTSGPIVPTVTGVSPSSGPASGGGTVTISGSGFPAAGSSPASVSVSIGALRAAVQSVAPDSIVVTVPKARAPAGSRAFAAASTLDVTVTLPAGASSGEVSSSPSPAARYQYIATSSAGSDLPTVSGLAPEGGLTSGGNRVRVYGNGFRAGGGVTAVTFGGEPARYSVLSDSELLATAPPETAATQCATGKGYDRANDCQVEMVVSDAAGSSATARIEPGYSGAVNYDSAGLVLAGHGVETAEAVTEYDYAAAPLITSISPNPATFQATTPVTVHGHNFDLLTLQWVDFGRPGSTSSQQVRFSYISPTEITVYPPAEEQAPGATPEPLPGGVTVVTLSGASNTVPFAYRAAGS